MMVKPVFIAAAVVVSGLLSGCYGRFEPYQETYIQVSTKKVIVPQCKPYDTASIEAAEKDCFVESARFQMMVNPEKVLKGN
ncbi:hypothetical protein M3P05_16165 [Sansalvadorimonas sp. 2012CJ34-2]|uniref:Lipoprotein n=1 Tax=Parendozoicomonas callyspongiae TaxID=2942213 RepID=A0ABT0PJ90_9GAMM|nr:hypothetical protein [Sansalvadorimonas sp. 2012CJ34-2]MCL6271457.1 hypothetical protein [Sansalvadorimonas sp. 2012CJ34-2]